MTTYTTQPDATDGIDTFIEDSNPTTNYGTNTGFIVGEWNGGSSIKRQLLKIDFSKGTNPPPATAVVTSATLYITPITDLSNNARTMSVYRVLRNWVEAQATWNVYSTGNNWGTAGCGNTTTDREATDIGTLSVPASPTLNSELSISLSVSAIQAWVSGTFANYGMLLKVNTETDDQITYASSDNATASYRPRLVVEYTAGGGLTLFSS